MDPKIKMKISIFYFSYLFGETLVLILNLEGNRNVLISKIQPLFFSNIQTHSKCMDATTAYNPTMYTRQKQAVRSKLLSFASAVS